MRVGRGPSGKAPACETSVYVTSRPAGPGSAPQFRRDVVQDDRRRLQQGQTAGGDVDRYVAGALPGAANVNVKPSPHGTTLPPSMGGKIL